MLSHRVCWEDWLNPCVENKQPLLAVKHQHVEIQEKKTVSFDLFCTSKKFTLFIHSLSKNSLHLESFVIHKPFYQCLIVTDFLPPSGPAFSKPTHSGRKSIFCGTQRQPDHHFSPALRRGLLHLPGSHCSRQHPGQGPAGGV